MTSRERVLAALGHREPDRVPRDFWAGPELTDRLCADLRCTDREALLRHFGIDLRTVPGPSYVGQELRVHEDGTVEDLWGVRRRTMTVGSGEQRWQYRHVEVSPLADAETAADIEAYDHWPSPDWWDYAAVASDCAALEGFAVVNAGDRLDRTAQFKPMMYIRGMEQAYVDLLADPDLADAIIAHIRDYFLQYNRRVFTAAEGRLDLFMMGDDFGTQHGPMMDVTTWRRFFRDGFRAFIKLAHEFDIPVMHHTCGSVVGLIPDFIECGLDVLQSLQPRAAGMDLAELKREFGRDLCFHGGLDIQQTLPQGSPDDVRDMVHRTLEAGAPGGGYILGTAHNIPPETPTENVVALYQAAEEFSTM